MYEQSLIFILKLTTYVSLFDAFLAPIVETDKYSLSSEGNFNLCANLFVMKVLWLALSSNTLALISLFPTEFCMGTIAVCNNTLSPEANSV